MFTKVLFYDCQVYKRLSKNIRVPLFLGVLGLTIGVPIGVGACMIIIVISIVIWHKKKKDRYVTTDFFHLGLYPAKPVLRVSNKGKLKPASSAAETR